MFIEDEEIVEKSHDAITKHVLLYLPVKINFKVTFIQIAGVRWGSLFSPFISDVFTIYIDSKMNDTYNYTS